MNNVIRVAILEKVPKMCFCQFPQCLRQKLWMDAFVSSILCSSVVLGFESHCQHCLEWCRWLQVWFQHCCLRTFWQLHDLHFACKLEFRIHKHTVCQKSVFCPKSTYSAFSIIKLFPERLIASMKDEKIAQNTTCFNILMIFLICLPNLTVNNELRPQKSSKLHFIALLAQAEMENEKFRSQTAVVAMK